MANDNQVMPDIEEQSLNPDGVDSAEIAPPATTTVAPPQSSSLTWKCLKIVGIWFLVFTLFIPLSILYVFWCGLFSKKRLLYEDRERGGVYNKINDFKSMTEKMESETASGAVRLGCVLLGWLILNLCVPSLRGVSILDYHLWKWSLLAVIISLGYPIVYCIVSFCFFGVAQTWEILTKRDGTYFSEGCVYAVALTTHCATILLAWKLYFGKDEGLKPSSKVGAVVTWSLVSLLVGAILETLKCVLMLNLEANAMYTRFKDRILMAGIKIYFVNLILTPADEKRRHPFLMCRVDRDLAFFAELDSTTPVHDGKQAAAVDTKCVWIQNYYRSNWVSLYGIKKVVSHFMGLANASSRGDDRVPIILAACKTTFTETNTRTPQETEEYVGTKFPFFIEKETQCLSKLLNAEHSSQQITCDELKKWIVDAHISCTLLGDTLLDVKAMLSSLNKVLTFSIVVVVILLWLIIMNLATTNVIVLIASPFLATTFVFGDTCKAFFQGVIFSFVRNPFNVGDHCIIDGLQLEVKNIGILTTTFIKIGTKEKISYPNSDLTNKRIANLESIPSPKDLIDLLLDSSTTKSRISDLKEKVESFLENDAQRNLYEKSHKVMVKEITTNIKISIEFKHFMNLHDVTHSQYAQKKMEQRSSLLITIKEFLDELDIKIAG